MTEFNDVLLSIENGQISQAKEQLMWLHLEGYQLTEQLENFRTTYGYDHTYMYELALKVINLMGEIK